MAKIVLTNLHKVIDEATTIDVSLLVVNTGAR